MAVRGDRDHPISRGYLCPKGRALLEQHDHPDRLRGSSRRLPDGTFAAISSEAAMDEIASRLMSLIARHGPSAVAPHRHRPAVLDVDFDAADRVAESAEGLVGLHHAGARARSRRRHGYPLVPNEVNETARRKPGRRVELAVGLS